MDYLYASDLPGFFFYLLISFIIKIALEFGKKQFTEISINFELKDLEMKMLSDNSNESQSISDDIFNPISMPPSGYKDIWSVSRLFYLNQIHNNENQSIQIKLLRILLKYYPIMEKYLPYILMASVCYILLFVNRGIFVAAEFAIFTIFFISLFIYLLNFSLISATQKHIKESISLTDFEEMKFKRALSLIHSTIFLRSIGIFWKMTDVVKWLFKND